MLMWILLRFSLDVDKYWSTLPERVMLNLAGGKLFCKQYLNNIIRFN